MRVPIRLVFALSAFACLFAAGTSAQNAAQQTPPSRPQVYQDARLIPPSSLARLNDPRLVVLHVGDKAGYDAQHIPAARQVSLADLAVSGAEAGGLTLQMLPADTLRDRLAALGISNDSPIVVYAATANVTAATRVVLTLAYTGLMDHTFLLDGGLAAWVDEGLSVTNVVAEPRTGTLDPLQIRSPAIVDAAFVKANLKTPNVSIVDARLTPFYEGTQVGGSAQAPHKTGHIDGAKSLPWSDLTTDQQSFKRADELRDRFAKAGVKPGDTIVVYCHIGQQASAVFFAGRLLGYRVLVYDGSFEDWSKQPDAPVSVIKK